MTKRRKPPVIDVEPDEYQPTKVEMEEDVELDRGDLSVDEAVEAQLKPVEIRRKAHRKRRR